MNLYTARMVHPDGPHPFPADLAEDRDVSRDPRSVACRADSIEGAREILERDNPEFEFHYGPDLVEE